MEGNNHVVPLSRSVTYLSSPRKPDHMVLSIIWRVLNLGWVHSRPPSFILATLPLYVLVKDQARRLNEVGPSF